MRHAVLALCVFVATAAGAEEAQLTVRVKVKERHIDPPTAFRGVGEFQIFRGTAKFADGVCPDLSDGEGKLVCVIKCSPKDTAAKTLRVVPPGSSLRVRGYVAPAAEEVKLDKCRLQPSNERVFVYVDAAAAMTALLSEEPRLALVARVVPDQKAIALSTTPEAIGALQAVGSSAKGRELLLRLQGVTQAAAISPEIKLDFSGRDSADKIPGVIGSIYFKELVKTKVSAKAAGNVLISADKSTYFTNLEAVEKELDKTVGRSSRQNVLLNDIQEWKGAPATSSTERLLKSLKSGP